MSKKTKSFFERLTGNLTPQDEEEEVETIVDGDDNEEEENNNNDDRDNEEEEEVKEEEEKQDWMEETENGQLTVDMHQTPSDIVIKAMIAGVKPDDLDVSIAKDMITIKGHRESASEISEDSYYYKELYWGGFSRSIMLPQEIDADGAEAKTKNGVLTITLPKIDKGKSQKLKIKSE